MLLDPFEEQFDLPASAIELGDGQCWDGKVVGQEDQQLAGLGIAITDATQRDGIIVSGSQAGHHDGLVEAQAGGFIHGLGATAGAAEVLLGTGNEERAALMNPMPANEVQVAAIHDVKRTGFPDKLVEDVDIMNTGSGDNDDGGKVALEGQQGVEFDGGFGAAKRGHGKSERQRSMVVESSA